MSQVSQSLQNLANVSSSGIPDNDPFIDYTLHIFQQSKQLSQIIAFIWRWIDEDNEDKSLDNEEIKLKKAAALTLKKAFDRPYDNTQMDPSDSLLWNLLLSVPRKDGNEQEKALYSVFPKYDPNTYDPVTRRVKYGYIFPIFRLMDMRHYTVKVDVNSFHGILEDPTTNNKNAKFGWVIPYPPRPQIGEATVTKKDLKDWAEWVEGDEVKPRKYFSDNPYIPTTCS